MLHSHFSCENNVKGMNATTTEISYLEFNIRIKNKF